RQGRECGRVVGSGTLYGSVVQPVAEIDEHVGTGVSEDAAGRVEAVPRTARTAACELVTDAEIDVGGVVGHVRTVRGAVDAAGGAGRVGGRSDLHRRGDVPGRAV